MARTVNEVVFEPCKGDACIEVKQNLCDFKKYREVDNSYLAAKILVMAVLKNLIKARNK